MEKITITCPCCGTVFEGEYWDDCPYCSWNYDGLEWEEDELFDDELAGPNPVPLGKARELVKHGKDVYGDPLPKK